MFNSKWRWISNNIWINLLSVTLYNGQYHRLLWKRKSMILQIDRKKIQFTNCKLVLDRLYQNGTELHKTALGKVGQVSWLWIIIPTINRHEMNGVAAWSLQIPYSKGFSRLFINSCRHNQRQGYTIAFIICQWKWNGKLNCSQWNTLQY